MSTTIDNRRSAPSTQETPTKRPDIARRMGGDLGAVRCDERSRSDIVMTSDGLGRGEYKYFSYPLPRAASTGPNPRHGVSRVRSGHRHTMGVIFHGAT